MAGLSFIGGASKVTGSCYLLNAGGLTILVDCGVEQEKGIPLSEGERKVSAIPKSDCLLLTHAHIDHSGLIPLLVKKNKTQRIISTPATKTLSSLLLFDFAKLQGQDGEPPIFNEDDIQKALAVWEERDDNIRFEIGKEVRATFLNSAHIVGAVSILIETPEGNYLFSGDIGTKAQKLMDYPPDVPKSNVDYLIIESTYGNKAHEISDNAKLADIINKTCGQGGKVLIPSFAVGRLQEVLYAVSQHKIQYPVYVDTPMGDKVNTLLDNYRLYLKKSLRKVAFNDNILGEYKTVNTRNQSLELAASKEPSVIISASGMLEGGRVLNHYDAIRGDKKSALVFVGYQAKGTRGRSVLDKEENVMCSVERLNSFSAHADKNELVEYVERLSSYPYKIYLTHGEDEQRKALYEALTKKKYRVEMPGNQDETSGNVYGNRPVVLNIPLEFHEFSGYRVSHLFGYAVEYADKIEIVPKSWYDVLYSKMEVEIMTSVTNDIAPCPNRTTSRVSSLSVEQVERNIGFLFTCGVYTKNRLGEFWEHFVVGPANAETYLISIHKINPNTDRRRWQPPINTNGKTEDELYDMAYETLLSAISLEKATLYRILNNYVKNL